MPTCAECGCSICIRILNSSGSFKEVVARKQTLRFLKNPNNPAEGPPSADFFAVNYCMAHSICKAATVGAANSQRCFTSCSQETTRLELFGCRYTLYLLYVYIHIYILCIYVCIIYSMHSIETCDLQFYECQFPNFSKLTMPQHRSQPVKLLSAAGETIFFEAHQEVFTLLCSKEPQARQCRSTQSASSHG